VQHAAEDTEPAWTLLAAPPRLVTALPLSLALALFLATRPSGPGDHSPGQGAGQVVVGESLDKCLATIPCVALNWDAPSPAAV
jgi:hypothetical protein